ncbi:MAG: L-seryl-tRNA(Sec) selenium transferase [Bacteroidales bacterium]
MNDNKELYKSIPGVDKLLESQHVKEIIKKYNADLVKFSIREVIQNYRQQITKSKTLKTDDQLLETIEEFVTSLVNNRFRRVYNATGVIIHTNLGRAPYSNKIIDDASGILKGYNNLEYDLEKGERGSRHAHLEAKLKYLTGAEDVLVVNNNAAAVMLILRTFAKGREVIVSRGELIEIGGSFRIPEIMAASDCIMKEVGATNKTHVKDYTNAINENTALLFKAHQSNFVIKGFTKEVELDELVAIGKKYIIPVVYDMGSGMLRKTSVDILKDEPDVKETLAKGIDIVSFSGDKLIGGPQAGIIAGKKEYISILKKEPMVRALRVGKTTLAYMESALSYYLDEKKLKRYNLIFSMIEQTETMLKNKAELLRKELKKSAVNSSIVSTEGYCGGGALPAQPLRSISVKIELDAQSKKERSEKSEKIFYALLKEETPVVGILKQGELYFDILTIPQEELKDVALTIARVTHKID